MNPQFHPLYDQATHLQQRFHDIAGSSSHPAAIAIRQQMHNLDIEMQHQKNPRLIEKHIGAIQLEMQQAQNAGDHFIDPTHMREFHNHYDQMRKQLRKNYYY